MALYCHCCQGRVEGEQDTRIARVTCVTCVACHMSRYCSDACRRNDESCHELECAFSQAVRPQTPTRLQRLLLRTLSARCEVKVSFDLRRVEPDLLGYFAASAAMMKHHLAGRLSQSVQQLTRLQCQLKCASFELDAGVGFSTQLARLNHACDPNCAVIAGEIRENSENSEVREVHENSENSKVREIREVRLVAMRPITDGEEVYSMHGGALILRFSSQSHTVVTCARINTQTRIDTQTRINTQTRDDAPFSQDTTFSSVAAVNAPICNKDERIADYKGSPATPVTNHNHALRQHQGNGQVQQQV